MNLSATTCANLIEDSHSTPHMTSRRRQSDRKRSGSRKHKWIAPLWAVVGICLILVVAGAFTLTYQSDRSTDAPKIQTLDELVRAYIESQGGMESIQSTHSLRISGNYYAGDEESAIPFTLIKKRPHYIRNIFDFPNYRRIQAFDGQTAWQLIEPGNPSHTEPSILTGEARRTLVQNAEFDHILVREFGSYKNLRFAGEVQFRGRDYYQVEQLGDRNQEIRILLDPVTYHDAYHLITDRDTGDLTELHYEDFQKIRGLYLARKITAHRNGSLVWQMEIDTIHMNIGVSDSFFHLPEHVE